MSDLPTNIPEDWLPMLIWPQYFYKQQKEFTNSTKWQRWFVGGNGTGKTAILYYNVHAYLLGIHPKQLAPPPLKARIIVPSFDNVESTALEKLQESQWVEPDHIEIGPLMPESQIKRNFSKDKPRIEYKNGSQIQFVTSEQGWKFMRGAQFDILAMDEECDHRVFDECVRGLRNAKGGGVILGAFTPPYELGKGPTWTKENIVDAAIVEPDIHVVSACMHDNPAITPTFIKRFSRGKTKEQIDVQVYGKYPSWGDVIFPFFKDRHWDPATKIGHILPDDTPMPDDSDVEWVMAFDWHQSKPCAAVFGFMDRDGNLTIFDELSPDLAKGKDIEELGEIFRNIGGDAGLIGRGRRFKRWQDPSSKHDYNAVLRGFNAWDAFRQQGIVTSAGQNRDPDVGISIMNDYFKGDGKAHPRLFIYERCKWLRRALNNHYWKRGEDGKGKPDPKWSDFPICVRYILQDVGWKFKKKSHKKWGLTSYSTREDTKRVVNLERFAFGGR